MKSFIDILADRRQTKKEDGKDCKHRQVVDEHDKYDNDVLDWLILKANKIENDASAHLKYVRNVLDEFDIHDADHSKAVLKIMEMLLSNHAEKLSSYDLFFLIVVSYLHDCGMAVSDFEINVMKLIENKKYNGKKVCTFKEAREIINKNKSKIFISKKSANGVKDWMFYPGSEDKLFDYYSRLLIDYQTFRNGKIEKIEKSNALEKTNKELRVDFIRRTHAKRAEEYIKTWGVSRFADFPNKTQGKKIAEDIAKVCKAHGEDIDDVSSLEDSVKYKGQESANLQFVAMMLRIGDIVHFTYDRAPAVLRSLHHFESEYSYEQWLIKEECGVDYTIDKEGQIEYMAYCSKPQDYYNLMKYIDGIDIELAHYNRLWVKGNWAKNFYPRMDKCEVKRGGVKSDGSFTPVPNLKFTLEQNKVLDLLIGEQLYSDDLACFRELYQNSMDACRCQIAIDKANKKESKGEIEFGMGMDDDEKRYIYCLDNGKGMSEKIIENYLLKIGSSYYKSEEFYQSQAATGNTFTPTSQFGIGILSCFLIGDKIEITTKEEKKKHITCVMESIHECFYYKESSSADMDLIPSSGTLVKVFLNEKYKDRISDEYLDNIEYLIWKSGVGLNGNSCYYYFPCDPHYYHLYLLLMR